MNKELRGKLLKIDKDFKDCYGDDWGDLYYHDIDAVDVITVVSLFIDSTTNSKLVEDVIKEFFDSKDPIGVMFAFLCCKAIM